jgi:hypothetical protein
MAMPPWDEPATGPRFSSGEVRNMATREQHGVPED